MCVQYIHSTSRKPLLNARGIVLRLQHYYLCEKKSVEKSTVITEAFKLRPAYRSRRWWTFTYQTHTELGANAVFTKNMPARKTDGKLVSLRLTVFCRGEDSRLRRRRRGAIISLLFLSFFIIVCCRYQCFVRTFLCSSSNKNKLAQADTGLPPSYLTIILQQLSYRYLLCQILLLHKMSICWRISRVHEDSGPGHCQNTKKAGCNSGTPRIVDMNFESDIEPNFDPTLKTFLKFVHCVEHSLYPGMIMSVCFSNELSKLIYSCNLLGALGPCGYCYHSFLGNFDLLCTYM